MMATKKRDKQTPDEKKQTEGTAARTRTVRRDSNEQPPVVHRSTAKRQQAESEASEKIRKTFGDGNVF